jgi:L-amino acid N-acyltransferase YncA
MRLFLIIRSVTIDDAPAITDIWNPVIRETVTTFTSVEKSLRDIQSLITERAALNYGFYVAEVAGTVLGFATYGPFRKGPGYARTMEHSVFLASEAKRQGIGLALMNNLEAHAKNTDVHSLIAGLSAGNKGAISFHAALGYAEVANIKQAGFKFGRWHDLVLMQKLL